MRIVIGVIRTQKEDLKRVWKLRKKNPEIFLFLDNCNSLRQKFKMFLRGLVYTEEELMEGLYKKGFLFHPNTFKRDSGKVDILFPINDKKSCDGCISLEYKSKDENLDDCEYCIRNPDYWDKHHRGKCKFK